MQLLPANARHGRCDRGLRSRSWAFGPWCSRSTFTRWGPAHSGYWRVPSRLIDIMTSCLYIALTTARAQISSLSYWPILANTQRSLSPVKHAACLSRGCYCATDLLPGPVNDIPLPVRIGYMSLVFRPSSNDNRVAPYLFLSALFFCYFADWVSVRLCLPFQSSCFRGPIRFLSRLASKSRPWHWASRKRGIWAVQLHVRSTGAVTAITSTRFVLGVIIAPFV